METRANHLLIGAFVLLLLAAGFAFVVWLARVDIDRSHNYYLIYFPDSVSGLSLGSTVRYNGIGVGTVTLLDIDPADPSRVRAVIEVDANTPVRTDTVAQLEFQGVTGVSFIQLTGGSPGSPRLEPGPGGKLPVIASVRSPIQELFAGGPELISRVIVLVNELTKIVNEENRTAIANILRDTQAVTARFAARAPEIERVLVGLEGSLNHVEAAAAGVDRLVQRLDELATTTDGLLDVEARTALLEVGEAAKSFGRASDQLEKLLRENEAPLSAFAGDGLLQFSRFIEESRTLVAGLSRLLEDIQSDPARFLFGNGRGGFEPDRQ